MAKPAQVKADLLSGDTKPSLCVSAALQGQKDMPFSDTHTHTHRALFNHPPSPNNYCSYLGKVIICSLVFQGTQLSGLRRNRDTKFACWSSIHVGFNLGSAQKGSLILGFFFFNKKSLELQLKMLCCIMQTLCMQHQSTSMLTLPFSVVHNHTEKNDIKSATS